MSKATCLYTVVAIITGAGITVYIYIYTHIYRCMYVCMYVFGYII